MSESLEKKESVLRLICLNCGMLLNERGCKVRCPRCGYFEDCSDGGNDHPNVTKIPPTR